VQIAIPLYDGVTALDAIGPYEVLSRLPGSTLTFVAEEPGLKRTDNGLLELVAPLSFHDVAQPDVIVVPGGPYARDIPAQNGLIEWIRAVHPHTTWTTSVCTGALLLGEAGVLEGLEATTHWLERETLRRYGATPSAERVVEQGKVITAAGVSSGIDMALTLAARIAGDDVAQALQLVIEYDPQPPFRSGSPESAPAHIVELVRQKVSAAAA
jgi:transcriptional regulator GlxA family with amidase domain